MENEIELRVAKPEDLNFIFATWLKSYRHSSQFARRISNTVFFTWHHKVIERLIGRGAQISVAHPKGEPDVILGYGCAELFDGQPVVHFIYVKKPFRRMGVATKLLEGLTPTLFTHWTADTEWIVKKRPELMYNPYLI